jgi:hypothetical protein
MEKGGEEERGKEGQERGERKRRRAGTSNILVVPARQAGNRFLGSFKGLKIRALHCTAAVLLSPYSLNISSNRPYNSCTEHLLYSSCTIKPPLFHISLLIVLSNSETLSAFFFTHTC